MSDYLDEFVQALLGMAILALVTSILFCLVGGVVGLVIRTWPFVPIALGVIFAIAAFAALLAWVMWALERRKEQGVT